MQGPAPGGGRFSGSFSSKRPSLTFSGGLFGIVFGSGIALIVHWLSYFPVSLGIGFSASVGVFFEMGAAVKASRLVAEPASLTRGMVK